MKLIIAGSRSFQDYTLLSRYLDHLLSRTDPSTIEVLMARGADLLVKKYAEERGIRVKEFPADWSMGRHAGLARNVQMAKEATHCVIFWDGQSPGSRHMMHTAWEYGLVTKVVVTKT